MPLILVALTMFLAAALAAVALSRNPGRASAIAVSAIVAGCAIGTFAAARALATGDEFTHQSEWGVPLGSFSVEIDSLSAIFLIVVFGVASLAAVYGVGYMREASRRQAAVGWSMYALLVGSMALVLIARNGVLFLFAWEVMALSSYFLVTLNDRSVEVRNAGKTYLIASHIGTACLLAFFLVASRGATTLDFAEMDRTARTATTSGALFLLALAGFGSKAGLFPGHVWLPDAHPAAPSHVSALMSGALVKLGIYGLLRSLELIGPPDAWWGWSLVGVGAVTAVGGALLAFAQHDLKRLLAYSTIENAGLICIGIGTGVLGLAHESPQLIALGFGAAILHVIVHAAFKTLLFLLAGIVDRTTGTRDMNRLGGLMKTMPLVGVAFAVGAVAAAGLPPLGGFVSEYLLFRAGTADAINSAVSSGVLTAMAAVVLALAGAIAAGAYLKAFGMVFLGAARSEAAIHARKPTWMMLGPVIVLAALCAGLGAATPMLLDIVSIGTSVPALRDESLVVGVLRTEIHGLRPLIFVFAMFAGATVILAGARLWLLSGRKVTKAVTWDCGYARPTARMQYTASSFAGPVVAMFGVFLRVRKSIIRPQGLFPKRAAFESTTPDLARDSIFRQVARWVDRSLVRMRWLQHGRTNIYILYIAATLLILLIWQVGLA